MCDAHLLFKPPQNTDYPERIKILLKYFFVFPPSFYHSTINDRTRINRFLLFHTKKCFHRHGRPLAASGLLRLNEQTLQGSENQLDHRVFLLV